MTGAQEVSKGTRPAVALSRKAQQWQERYGPWAVVTGASEGIGREIARELAGRGLNLVLVARRATVLAKLAEELSDRFGIETLVLPADLSVANAVQQVMAETDHLDTGLIVAAAGFGTSGRFLDADIEQELNMLDVNCRTSLAMALHYGRRFARRGRGGIILLSSLVAFQGVPRAAHYAATKAYVQSLAEALYLELAPLGVDVLASAPGPVDTGFAARSRLQVGKALEPSGVAQATLVALGRSATVRPGWLSKLLEYSLAMLPRRGRVRVMGLVMGGMTRHQDGNTETEVQRSTRGLH
jgi:uncharacterized protein